ncbi:MAG: Rnase Y domain-containing protein, partial [Muribaculaceae bacterium]|nr:Rnase Y domain-containing protein [Muribaculaceae bacterium]
MNTAIWILVAIVAAAAGFAIALRISRNSAGSRANAIIDEARREADVIKEKKILEAKEEEIKLLNDAER